MSTVATDVDPHNARPQTEQLIELEPNPSLRLLVMGNFSGRATSKLTRVDRDNFDSILRSLAPQVEVAPGNGQLGDTDLVFRSLTDFEPDSIYRKSELFASLRDQTGPALYSEPEESETQPPLQPTPEQISRLTSPGGLLDSILEKSVTERSNGGGAVAAPKKSDALQSMVQRIVAPYATPAESSESKRVAGERIQRLSLLMAHVLHDPGFQALEAAWRGLDLLVHGLDTDAQIHLYLFDISKEALISALQVNSDVRRTSIYRTLTEDERWGLIAADFSFDREVVQDVEALEQIGALAQALGAPFFAEWLSSQQESAKAQAAWQAFRRSGAAQYVALALPRFLLRLPYGKDTVSIEEFEFEETHGEPVHTEYLWGNPAFACALVLGQLYEQQASLAPTPAYMRLSGLPLHVFKVDGEMKARPCTEVLLSDNDCTALLDEGVLPVAAVKGSDSIAFPSFRAVGEGSRSLFGSA